MSLIGIEGFTNLMKDTSSGGVVNVDKRSYDNYMKTKAIAQRNVQQQKATQDTVADLQNEINNIKGDLTDIRQMLIQILQKGN